MVNQRCGRFRLAMQFVGSAGELNMASTLWPHVDSGRASGIAFGWALGLPTPVGKEKGILQHIMARLPNDAEQACGEPSISDTLSIIDGRKDAIWVSGTRSFSHTAAVLGAPFLVIGDGRWFFEVPSEDRIRRSPSAVSAGSTRAPTPVTLLACRPCLSDGIRLRRLHRTLSPWCSGWLLMLAFFFMYF